MLCKWFWDRFLEQTNNTGELEMNFWNKKHNFQSTPFAIWMILIVAPVLFPAGCNQAEQAGETAKEVVSQAGETVNDAAKDAAKDVGDKLSEGFSAAAEKASSALEGIDGGAEILTKVKDLFGSAQTTLSGVTDKVSAEAATSKLSELNGAVDSLGNLIGKLPAQAKSALGGVIDQGVQQLESLVEKVVALPGISDVIKPKMDEIIKKLKALTV
jgi:hypothetical protein